MSLQLDPQALIADFADENAKTVTRALVAEAQGKEYVRIITGQQRAIERLSEHAPHELLVELGLEEGEPAPTTPMSENGPTPIRATRKRAAKKAAGSKGGA